MLLSAVFALPSRVKTAPGVNPMANSERLGIEHPGKFLKKIESLDRFLRVKATPTHGEVGRRLTDSLTSLA
jgi:hypothetical protein